jgi:hypothetical protein
MYKETHLFVGNEWMNDWSKKNKKKVKKKMGSLTLYVFSNTSFPPKGLL